MVADVEHYVGGYRLVDAIGAGSFATVYRAIDERIDDTVAIKLLAENHSLNPEIRERFIAEGRNLRRVGGGHVVGVYDIGESETHQPYLVLEHADHGSLRDRVEYLWGTGWVASASDLLDLARRLAAAVGAVHRQRLVHRDLSPGNLLLSSRTGAGTSLGSAIVHHDERLLVADLGMCKDLAVHSGLTVSGGTDGFRPPEQMGPGVVDVRADVWALSALLKWAARGSAASRSMNAVLKRGMSERPSRRHPDAETWLRDVEAALTPPPSAGTPGSPTSDESGRAAQETSSGAASAVPSAPGRRRKRRLRRIGLVVALACALVAGLFLGHWFFADLGRPPTHTASSSLAISGPREITVGRPATFTAKVTGVDSWAWTLPNHRSVADRTRVTVTARTPGTGVLVLRSQTSDGEDLEVRRTIRVRE